MTLPPINLYYLYNKKSATLNDCGLSVGATGFEPATTWSQTRCATGLRYTPGGLFKQIQSFENFNHLLECAVNLLSCVGCHQ